MSEERVIRNRKVVAIKARLYDVAGTAKRFELDRELEALERFRREVAELESEEICYLELGRRRQLIVNEIGRACTMEALARVGTEAESAECLQEGHFPIRFKDKGTAQSSTGVSPSVLAEAARFGDTTLGTTA